MEESKTGQKPMKQIDPDAVYAIRGGALIAAMRMLDSEIPCRFISTVDSVSRALMTAEPLGLPGPDGAEPGTTQED